MSDIQYKIVSGLFNEMNEEFWRLSPATQDAFFKRLYAK